MVKLKKCISLALISGVAFAAQADEAGDFDYYVLALSWNSGWCEIEGAEKQAPQCVDEKRAGFTLHGLWPQYEEGWPEFCSTAERNPSHSETARQAELYGSSGSAWHQWNKHGRCTGLGYGDYYDLSAEVFARYPAPEIFMQIDETMEIAPDVIEEAMIETYPELNDDNMAVVCRDGVFQELRICLNKDLEPTDCLGRAAQDCSYSPEFLPSY